MADSGGQSLSSIAAGMMSKAAAKTKSAPSGIIGGAIEAVTGQVQDYNSAIEKNTKLQMQQAKELEKLAKVKDRLAEIERIRDQGLVKGKKHRKALKEEVKNLTKELEKLADVHSETNQELSKSQTKLDKMSDSTGLTSNSFAVFTTQIAGAVTGLVSLRDVLGSVNIRMDYSRKQLIALGDTTTDYQTTQEAVIKGALEWNEAINDASWEMANFGFKVEETNAIIGTLADGLRVSTNNQRDLAKMTGQMTQDIGFMSKLLQTSTDDLATATVIASKKFGKSTGAMADDLAGMYDAIQMVKKGSPDLRISIRDLSRAALDAQASFQGHNLNLRETARLMGSVAAKAQEQGATYEQSMKAAQGLTDIISGGGAPDWAKYMAGSKMLKEVKKLHKVALDEGSNFREAIANQFGDKFAKDLTESQVTSMRTLAKNYRKYGKLSASYMAEELLRGTEKGNEAMFDLLKKYGTGHEGRELLKQVWGLDDAAATAATLALDTAKTYEDLSTLVDKGKRDTKDRKPPTIGDLRDQTQQFVEGTVAITDVIRAKFDALRSNPAISAIIGAIGGGTSVALQILQATAAMKMSGMGGLGGKAGAAMGKAGAVVAAGAAGYALGTALRAASDAVAEFTGVQYFSIDKLTQLGFDTFSDHLKIASFGLIDFREGMSDAEQSVKALSGASEGVKKGLKVVADGLAKGVDESSVEFKRAAFMLASASDEDIKAYAEKTAKMAGITKQEAEIRLKAMRDLRISSDEVLKANQAVAAQTGWKSTQGLSPQTAEKKMGPVAAAMAPKKKTEKEKALSVATIPPLTPAQRKAVSQRVATKLAPEVAAMSQTMFEKMSDQSTEFFANMTGANNAFWTDTLPKLAGASYDKMIKSFDTKLKKLRGPEFTPIEFDKEGTAGGAKGETGPGGMAASISPDGSIMIKMMLPRDAIDASERAAKSYTR